MLVQPPFVHAASFPKVSLPSPPARSNGVHIKKTLRASASDIPSRSPDAMPQNHAHRLSAAAVAVAALLLSGCSATGNLWPFAQDAADAESAAETQRNPQAVKAEKDASQTDASDEDAGWLSALYFWKSSDEEQTAEAKQAEPSEADGNADAAEPAKSGAQADAKAGSALVFSTEPAFPFDASVSYAKNVLDVLGLERIADRPYDPALPSTLDATFTLYPQLVDGDPIMAVESKDGSFLGFNPTGWGRSIRDAVMPSTPNELRNHAVGFVDAALVSSRTEAQKRFAGEFAAALQKALKSQNLQVESVANPRRGTYALDDFTVAAVTFSDNARGCPKPHPELSPKSLCRAWVRIDDKKAEEEPVRAASAWMGVPMNAHSGRVHVFRSVSWGLMLPKGASLETAPLYHELAQALPAGTQLYVAPAQTSAGWLEPYVLDVRGAYRFMSAK